MGPSTMDTINVKDDVEAPKMDETSIADSSSGNDDEDNGQEGDTFGDLPVLRTSTSKGRTSLKGQADGNGNEDQQGVASGRSRDKNDSSSSNIGSIVSTLIEILKYVYSMGLLLLSIAIIMALIFTKQTKMALNLNSGIAFVVIWFLLLWLAMMEGGQGCLVGLKPIDINLYKTSHTKALRSTNVAYKGDNMERFIIGRQFLVVLVVFVTNLCGAAIPDATPVLNLPDIVTQIFVNSGVAMILMTIMVGQLTAQVTAATCMLDFINNYFMVFTTYASLAIEYSGLMHCVYLVQIVFAKLANMPIESNEPPRNKKQKILFWSRVIFSLLVLGYAMAVTLSALFNNQTTMWDGVPSSISVIIFFVLMCFVGIMEGMQIALFAVKNSLCDDELMKLSSVAHANCQLAFKGTNLQAFLIGRQILVTICMFVVARITTLNVAVGEGNVFGVSDGIQGFFNTGLLGAVITTVCASLAWRIIAASFPVGFLANPLVYVIIRICLVLEASGLCSASWLMALIHKKIARFQIDDTYIGTPQERRAAMLAATAKERPTLARPSMKSYRSTSLMFSISDLDLNLAKDDEESGVFSSSDMRMSMHSFRSPSLKLLNI